MIEQQYLAKHETISPENLLIYSGKNLQPFNSRGRQTDTRNADVGWFSLRCTTFTCVLGDVVQQKRVLCESQHLHGNDVLQLQPATQAVSFSCLRNRKTKKNRSCCCSHACFLNGQSVCGRSDLHEKGEPLIFLLLTLDELQCRRHVTAECSDCALYLLLFLTTKLDLFKERWLNKWRCCHPWNGSRSFYWPKPGDHLQSAQSLMSRSSFWSPASVL